MTHETPEDVVKWQLRGIEGAKQKTPKHNPMGGEDGVYYLFPPGPGVHFFMVEFGYTRREAEFMVDIT